MIIFAWWKLPIPPYAAINQHTLFFSNKLTRSLKPKNLQAAIAHELSHPSLDASFNDAVFGFSAITGVVALGLAAAAIWAGHKNKNNLAVLAMVSCALTICVQIAGKAALARQLEFEADRAAAYLTSPQQVIDMFRQIKSEYPDYDHENRDNFFSGATHPSLMARISAIEAEKANFTADGQVIDPQRMPNFLQQKPAFTRRLKR
ncbi:MAG: M48 family metalloprotease [Alphaproteobacteria bacterium]